MIAFFKKRPGASLLFTLGMFIAGAVLARQTGTPPVVSTALAKAAPAHRAAPPDWRDKLDLSRATVDGRHLVQVLKDGTQINLTLDPDLQQWASSYMRDHELPYGAMFLYELDSGNTLVMAGYSAEDPKTGAEDLCLTPWAPAASVFKLVTASALLENGVPASTKVCYHGGLRGIRKHHLVDSPRLDTTCKSLSYAVAKSVNPVVGKLALRYLNARSLRRWSRRYGFNRSIPFELAAQPSKADIPSTELELAQVAAGFWHTEASALHGAVIAGVAASRGLLRWPHIVASVRRPDGSAEIPEPADAERVMSRRSADALAEAMVMTTTIGTGRKGFFSRRGRPFLPDVKVGGKTGSLSRRRPFLHYNWFVGFAPAEKPRVALAVLLGNPARWRIKAHTAARNLLARYYRSRKGPEPVADARTPGKPLASITPAP